ncbi:hypothetical protein ACFVUS_10700 [Nocardia sp. NPDC058058]|uniref:hypothetical protein n=1 Tax=Nocardia sp. NPDC058058 TaxID=3346317 RepID=UPI0036DCFB8E
MSDNFTDRGEALVTAATAGDTESVRRLTEAFVAAGLIDEAIPYWERARSDAFAAYTLARYRKIRGDRAAAERLYREGAQRDRGCAYGLAVLLQEDRDPEAAEWFRHGASLGSLDCKIEAGKILAAQGRLTEAVEFLMAGAELGDIAVFRPVRLFEGLRADLDAAAADLAEASDAEEAAEPRHALNEIRGRLKDYPGLLPEFERHYRRAAELGDTAAMADHAIALDECGEPFEPIGALLLRARELGYAGATYLLGLFAESRGLLADAERWYLEAAEADHESAQWNLAVLCLRQRRLDEASHWFGRIDPDDPDVPGKLAAIEQMCGQDHSDRLDAFARLPEWLSRAESGDTAAGYEYGSTLWAWGGAAARHMVRWVRPAAEAGNALAAETLSKMYDQLTEPAQRDHWQRRAAELGDADCAVSMGLLSEHHHDWQEAERWYERAVPGSGGLAHMFAGKLKAQRGAYAEAEPLLLHAYRAGADREYALEATAYYGYVLHRLGRSAEAAPLLRTAADRWREVARRYTRDDLAILSRTPDFAALAEDAEYAAKANAGANATACTAEPTSDDITSISAGQTAGLVVRESDS